MPATHLAPRVCRHSFANFVFQAKTWERRKTGLQRNERGVASCALYWLVNDSGGTGDENSVENTDCATRHVCPSNLSHALDAPLALHTDSWRAKPPPCPGFFMMLIYIYISYRSMNPFANIIFVPVFPCFPFCFSFFFLFFGSNLYSGLEEKFYFITRYIGFFVNRNEPSRIHLLSGFCIRVINFVSRFYLS